MEFLPLLTTALLLLLLRLLHAVLLRPLFVLLHFRRRSVGGPPFLPLLGNTPAILRLQSSSAPTIPLRHHDLVPGRVLPHVHLWSRTYGRTFLFFHGPTPRLVLGDPALVRRVALDPSAAFSKVAFNPLSRQLFGEGLVGLRGPRWALHRRVLAPAFAVDRVKSWVPEIAAAAAEMLGRWGREGGEVEVHRELHGFTAEVISRVAFGSSYREGSRIFELQEKQLELVSMALRTVYIPGFRFIPTKRNRRRRELNREIRDSIRQLIKAKSERSETNLIKLMLESNREEGEKLGIEEIIDECKTFYFAGKETTANLLTWTLYLLALDEDWQSRCREEVLNTLGGRDSPGPEDMSNLKLVSMVLNETLRLYPPATFLRRVVTKSTKLSSLDVPAGIEIILPVIALNYDTEIWGENASQFNPLRFADSQRPTGVFFPFGLSPTICIGQTLALIEAKVAIAMILKRYTWNVSPSYVHAPTLLLTLQPQYGLQLLFQSL